VGEEHASMPPEKLAEIAESRAFRLLLEAHAQEAISRVLKRLAWVVTPVMVVLGGVGGWFGWSRYTSWHETIARVDREMSSLDATVKQFEAKVQAAQAQIETADRLSQSSRELVLGVQSGVTAAATMLQRQADTLSDTVAAQAADTKANADAVRADKQAIAMHRASVERDASAVQEAATSVGPVVGRVEKLWQQVVNIEDIQVELSKARLFHLVLLTAHAKQTIEIPDPCAPSPRPYELTFHSEGLRGAESQKNKRVRVIKVAVDVREPAGNRFSRVIPFDDDPDVREFHGLEGTPFEVVLDFRYHRSLFVKDFVALRIRPGDRCQAAVPSATR